MCYESSNSAHRVTEQCLFTLFIQQHLEKLHAEEKQQKKRKKRKQKHRKKKKHSKESSSSSSEDDDSDSDADDKDKKLSKVLKLSNPLQYHVTCKQKFVEPLAASSSFYCY